MLKVKLTKEEFDDLASDDLRGHYREDGDSYVLVTDEASGAQRALKAERRQREAAENMLIELVPDLAKEEDRGKWRGLVQERAQLLIEVEDLDPADVRRYRDRDEDEDGRVDESELQQQLRDAQAANRKLEREVEKRSREMERLTGELEQSRGEKDSLIRTRDINVALDAANVTVPGKRKVVHALWASGDVGYGLQVVDGETMITVDGEQVPVIEWASDWANTVEGKEYATAPDNSGGGDGGEPRPPKGGDRKRNADGENLSPAEMIALGYEASGTK